MRSREDPYTFPTEGSTHFAFLCVPTNCIPFFRRFFQHLQEQSSWVTRDDWKRGYQFAAEMELQLVTNCIENLIKEQQRTYRLLETVFYGTEWTATEIDGETVITPDLPDVPPSVAHLGSVMARLERMEVLLDNFFNGVTYPDWELEDDVSARALLTGVINRLKAGDPEGDAILEEIRELLL